MKQGDPGEFLVIEKLRVLTIQRRLLILFVLAIVLAVTTAYIGSYYLHRTLIHDRKVQTRDLVQTATGVLARFHQLQTAGKLTEKEAKTQAEDALRGLRYGSSGYFWINDLNAVMVMHPMKPSLQGKNLFGLKDPDGKPLFADIVKVAKNKGEGEVDYLWPKPGHNAPVAKISYVKLFKPWGWVVGSGVYTDDIGNEYWHMVYVYALLIGIGIVVLMLVDIVISRSIVSPLARSALALENIASGDGDLTQRLPEGGKDETARLNTAFNIFVGKIESMVAELHQIIRKNRQDSSSVADVVKEAEKASGEQKQELDTIAAAVEQMVTTNEDVARRLSESAQAAKEADDATSRGSHVVREVNSEMESLAGKVIQSAEIVSQLAAESQNIGGVLDVIRGVAEQTNLLALNAAIEAARAGEQGRGFAVVADEVRALAKRTQDSTEEIDTMIQRLQDGSEKAVSAITESQSESETVRERVSVAGKTLEQIEQLMGQITDLTQHLAAAAEEQTQTSGEISRSLNGLAGYGDNLVSRLSDTASTAGSMSEAAMRLETIANQFRIKGASSSG